MVDRERGLPLSDEDLHRLYRLCECGRWIRRTDTEAWELHKDVVCPVNTERGGRF